jgi:hypothetical protein
VDERARRVGENEALFRRTNEEIERLTDSMSDATAVSSPTGLMAVCECGRLECTARLDVPRDVYERARADSACFIVKPGHDAADVEHVSEQTDEYMIVRKASGEPTGLAERTDPRS